MKKSSSSSSFSFSFSFSLSLTLSLLLSLPLHAAEVTAVLDFNSHPWGNLDYPVYDYEASVPRIVWQSSSTNLAVRKVSEETQNTTRYLCASSSSMISFRTIFDGGMDNVIPHVRSFSFRAKAVNSVNSNPCFVEVQYRVSDGDWTTDDLISVPALSTLSTDWQMFTITLPEGHDSASLRLWISTGSNIILLDDFVVTYDPDYVAPAPDPEPATCANCFQVIIQ